VPQLRFLDGVVGVKGVRDPMVTIVVSTSCYLHFVSCVLTLTAFCVISLHWRRLSSFIMPWVCDGVSLDVGSISCIIGDVVGGIGWSICRSVSCRVSWSISCSVRSGIDRLHYFIFTSSLFSYRLKGTLATASLARMFRSAPGVGTCRGSTISRTSFLNLSGGGTDVSLETSYCRRIFEVV
jgi:tetrahydromethanopterin S-methyltransferase subunit D